MFANQPLSFSYRLYEFSLMQIAELVATEFFEQGDKERRELNIEPSVSASVSLRQLSECVPQHPNLNLHGHKSVVCAWLLGQNLDIPITLISVVFFYSELYIESCLSHFVCAL